MNIEIAGYVPLIIETGSQQVVALVLSKKGAQTRIFWMVFEIQANLKRLQRIKIHYTSRNCNEVARSLAKTTLEQVNFVSWLDNNPAQYMYLFFETL